MGLNNFFSLMKYWQKNLGLTVIGDGEQLQVHAEAVGK